MFRSVGAVWQRVATLKLKLHHTQTAAISTELCCSYFSTQKIGSNGVKVLLSGRPLRHYTTSNNLTHGLHLDCCLRCFGGDGSDDDESDNIMLYISLLALSALHMPCA